jgi:WD40 repeat protein
MRRHRLTILRVVLWTLAPLSLGGALWRVRSWRPVRIAFPVPRGGGDFVPIASNVHKDTIDVCCGVNGFQWPATTVQNWDGARYHVRLLSMPITLAQGTLAPDGNALASTIPDSSDLLQSDLMVNWNFPARRCTWAVRKGKTVLGGKGIVFPRDEFIDGEGTLAFNPKGDSLAAEIRERNPAGAFDKQIYVFDATDGRVKLHRDMGAQGAVAGLAFTKDGRTLFDCEQTGRVLMLDSATLNPKCIWQGPNGRVSRHRFVVNIFALAPNASYVAIGMDSPALGKPGDWTHGAKITLWSLKDYRQHGPLWHSGPGVQQMAFNPDGTLLALAETDGSVTVLRVPAMTILRKIPQRTKPNWTADGNTLIAFGPDSLYFQRMR